MTLRTRTHHLLLLAATLTLWTAACSDDDATSDPAPSSDAGDDTSAPDATTTLDTSAPEPDALLLDADLTEPLPPPREIAECDEGGVILAWSLVERAVQPVASFETADGITTAVIDASAGGMNEAANNPFVYVDLDAGVMLPTNDYDALDDTRWELALRRTAFRTNSGHSGPGAVQLGQLRDTTLEAVTSIDGVTEWEIDESFDPECGLYADPLGSPLTAINYLNGDNPSGSESWYNYEGGVSPVPGHVYVLRGTTDGAAFAFTIDAWESGVYTMRWRTL